MSAHQGLCQETRNQSRGQETQMKAKVETGPLKQRPSRDSLGTQRDRKHADKERSHEQMPDQGAFGQLHI